MSKIGQIKITYGVKLLLKLVSIQDMNNVYIVKTHSYRHTEIYLGLHVSESNRYYSMK